MRRLLPAFQPHEELTAQEIHARQVHDRRVEAARLAPRCRLCGKLVRGPVLACAAHLDEARVA